VERLLGGLAGELVPVEGQRHNPQPLLRLVCVVCEREREREQVDSVGRTEAGRGRGVRGGEARRREARR